MTHITIKREVLEQAYDAMELYHHEPEVSEALDALRTALEAKDVEPVQPIYYMRDNHTFKRLSEDVPTALLEIEAEFNQGYTCGGLCSKRKGFTTINASGSNNRLKFFQACKERLESIYPAHPATDARKGKA